MTDGRYAIIDFEKIVPEGKALGYWEGRACFAVGPVPGERAEIELTRVKARFAEGRLVRVITPSHQRTNAREEHFMACSPWQGIVYDYQLELKARMLSELFARPELQRKVSEMVASPARLGYRNKLEFALQQDASGRVGLALHERDDYTRLVPAPMGCVLASPAMNAAVIATAGRLTDLGLADLVRAITVRESSMDGQIGLVVWVLEETRADWRGLIGDDVSGLITARRLPNGRIEVLDRIGTTNLIESVGGLTLSYPLESFFQTNVRAFDQALRHIAEYVPAESRVADLYGGVGAIGLMVAERAQSVLGIEIDAEAARQANANAARLGITNYAVRAIGAEALTSDALSGVDCVIVDPPRAGLDRSVIRSLLAAAPRRIIYLSCNPATQVRDAILLGSAYRVQEVTGFDFYPGTLHLESLAILDRIL